MVARLAHTSSSIIELAIKNCDENSSFEIYILKFSSFLLIIIFETLFYRSVGTCG